MSDDKPKEKEAEKKDAEKPEAKPKGGDQYCYPNKWSRTVDRSVFG